MPSTSTFVICPPPAFPWSAMERKSPMSDLSCTMPPATQYLALAQDTVRNLSPSVPYPMSPPIAFQFWFSYVSTIIWSPGPPAAVHPTASQNVVPGAQDTLVRISSGLTDTLSLGDHVFPS